MVCGKPVVSTNLPRGVPFVNQDGKTGIVVLSKDPQALAKAINTLLDEPALSAVWGQVSTFDIDFAPARYHSHKDRV
ncbi:hypothetical protein DRJ00_08915 [Candidatus Aerophobetes bacterium]|uniref:Glycosyl transferase family 1 domain-containing protein n=1 Tax=Aerophobetes bacterium TaxID=2030807 RepID=A0A497E290_UNCAE|nr:MAG: hypothetical protein DRJ00_08915 [Candidatus Aerophobetes bacterium]